MSGYLARLTALRDALGPAGLATSTQYGVPDYRPSCDALIRRAAESLTDDQVLDVVALITLARGNR